MPPLTHRLALERDLPALRNIMRASIEQLQADVLTTAQVQASHKVMGLDTQLIDDRTYFVVMADDNIVGCGGWSYRATLFGGDHSKDQRNPLLLDPATDAARVRAMYTAPDFARRGVGRCILSLCEAAAAASGFQTTELMATLAGLPLYRAAGYAIIAPGDYVADDGTVVPLFRMSKALEIAPAATKTDI